MTSAVEVLPPVPRRSDDPPDADPLNGLKPEEARLVQLLAGGEKLEDALDKAGLQSWRSPAGRERAKALEAAVSLLARPRVAKAARALLEARMLAEMPDTIRTLRHLRDNASREKIRLEAATQMLRVGLGSESPGARSENPIVSGGITIVLND